MDIRRFSILQRAAAAILLLINLCLLAAVNIPAGAFTQTTPVAIDADADAYFAGAADFSGIATKGGLKEDIPADDKAVSSASDTQFVYLGGMPLGLELKNRGLMVIGKTDVVTSQGLVNPTKGCDIDIGDSIVNVDGKDVNTAEELSEIINLPANRGKQLDCIVKKRGGRTVKTKISSALDIGSGKYRTGLFVRQDSVGIGTLTFVRKDLRFAALGHPVVDTENKEIMPISGGRVLGCTVAGSIAGERGKPGELKGIVLKERVYGTIDKNCQFGLYGYLYNLIPGNINDEQLIETMPRAQIKPGSAQIYTTVSGGQPRLYDIEIVKTAYQSRPSDRSMVIRVTDRELLKETGGIVQGMSGSPILQDGKLCGAVTHVFINDPTRGYGLYSDWMLGN